MKIPILLKVISKNIHIPLFFMALALPACLETNLSENRSIPSGKHTVVIMPGQTCTKTENGRNLFGEDILHPSHKECYYK
ncbi:hypothetical protein N9X27_03080 [Amylibacter sp.]|nr:hypothetical protein [Amylibacter sp.]